MTRLRTSPPLPRVKSSHTLSSRTTPLRALSPVGVARRVAVAATIAAALITGCSEAASEPTRRVVDTPGAYTPSGWTEILGGDGSFDPAGVAAAASASDLPDADAARTVAGAVVLADTTGAGRDAHPGYFPPQHPAGSCQASVDTVLVASMPIDTSFARGERDASARWAKALVLWRGTCAFTPLTTFGEDVATAVVYLRDDGDGWAAVREGVIPQQPQPRLSAPVAPPDWAVEPLTGCSASRLEARLEVVAAWELLCDAARNAGVPLTATSALRDADEQADRFDAAVRAYGGQDAARRRVAYSDGQQCESRHCSATAVDVRPDTQTMTWLRAVAGCATRDGMFETGRDCSEGETSVRTMERYGFTEPLVGSPGHLEFILPVERLDDAGPCAAPPTSGSIEQIAATWRCELAVAGIAGSAADDIVAQAIATAEACSGLDPAWRYADGAYATTPDPSTGTLRNEAGIFALPRELSDGSSLPGESALTVRGQALAAARVYITERSAGRSGWDAFGCSVDSVPQWARDAALR